MVKLMPLIALSLLFLFKRIDANKNSSVISWSFGALTPFNKSVEFGLHFYAPTTPGSYPVIIFLTGLDGIALGQLYTDFSTHIVEQSNTILIEFDGLKAIHFPNKEEKLFEKTLNWTIQNIDGLFNNEKTPNVIKNLVFPDVKTYGVSLMGHSSGCHPTVSYLNATCGIVKSLILLDPVDGFDPFGIVKDYITNPPEQLPFITPTLIISTGLDAVSIFAHGVACAPANISNVRFYNSLSGPTWLNNFTTYGHADILDDWIRPIASDFVCKSCDTNCNYPLYRKNIARAISVFILAIHNKDPKYLSAVENPSASGLYDPEIKIESFYKLNNYDVLKTGPFCNHS